MFVDIKHPKSPLKIANILTAYDKGVVIKGVRQPKEKLTPEVCFDILKSTNYPRCIRDMLTCIAKLPASEQAQFKEVVLSCFDNREQPEPILQLGQELAEKSGYGIDFAKAQKIKDGPYLFSEVNARKCEVRVDAVFTDEDFSVYDKVIFVSHDKIQFDYRVKFPKTLEFPNSSDVSFSGKNKGLRAPKCDLQGVQSICFKDGAKVDLREAYNLPTDIDFSMCDEVNLGECDLSSQPNLRFKEGASVDLSGAKNLPENLDLSMCDEVDLSGCDLKGQPHLRFKDGGIVNLSGAENLPPNLDVSCCDEVYLSHCDLRRQPHLRFKEGAKVDLSGAENFPSNFDLSKCSELWLCECDLTSLPHLRFKDGAKVDLCAAFNLPENLDFSQCAEVNLRRCDLSEQPNLRFKNGAMVNLSMTKKLPEILDFSLCNRVDLIESNLSLVKKLIFRTHQQMEDSHLQLSDDWKGKLVFAEDERRLPPLSFFFSRDDDPRNSWR